MKTKHILPLAVLLAATTSAFASGKARVSTDPCKPDAATLASEKAIENLRKIREQRCAQQKQWEEFERQRSNAPAKK